jgi:SAM-dependent methyltransferase
MPGSFRPWRLEKFPHVPGVVSNEYPKLRCLLRSILSTFAFHHRTRGLDIGAGTGELTRVLAGMVDELAVMEPNDRSRRKLLQLAPGAMPILGRIEDASSGLLPHADVVLMSHVLYYVRSDRWPSVIGNVLGSLNAGGRLIVILWSQQSPNYSIFERFSYRRDERLSAENLMERAFEHEWSVTSIQNVSSVHIVQRSSLNAYLRFLCLPLSASSQVRAPILSARIHSFGLGQEAVKFEQIDSIIILEK